jgi:hypothetical protein
VAQEEQEQPGQPPLFGAVAAQEKLISYICNLDMPPATVINTRDGWDVVDMAGRRLATVYSDGLFWDGLDLAHMLADMSQLLRRVYEVTHGSSLEQLYEGMWEWPDIKALMAAIERLQRYLPSVEPPSLSPEQLKQLLEAGVEVSRCYEEARDFSNVIAKAT